MSCVGIWGDGLGNGGCRRDNSDFPYRVGFKGWKGKNRSVGYLINLGNICFFLFEKKVIFFYMFEESNMSKI